MKTLHYTTKNGRRVKVSFGYAAEGECFTNFNAAQKFLLSDEIVPVPFTAFISTDEPDRMDCWEPNDSKFMCHHAISAEQKDIYIRHYLKKFEEEGWTLRE